MSALVVILLRLCQFIDATSSCRQYEIRVGQYIVDHVADEDCCYSSFCGLGEFYCGESDRNLYFRVISSSTIDIDLKISSGELYVGFSLPCSCGLPTFIGMERT